MIGVKRRGGRVIHGESLQRVWTPLVLKPLAYYDADRGITLNSSTVSSWADSSGSGDANRTVVQATQAAQPLYTAKDSDFNGHGSLTFSGAQQMRSGTWSTQPVAATHYLVGKFTQVSGAHVAVGCIDGAHHVCYFADSNIHLLNNIDITAAYSYGLSVLAFVVNSTTSAVYVNNSLAISGNTGLYAMHGLMFGAYWDNTLPLTGKIAFESTFSGAHSAATIAKVSRYLGAKYGITVA